MKSLLFLLDNVKEEYQGIYCEMEGYTQKDFDWGMKNYMISVEFIGYYKTFEGKVCREIRVF